MSRGKLIVIVGPVGVGKSTTINGLISILSSKGIKARKTFVKTFHGLSYVLWKLIVRILGLPKNYAPWYIIPRHGHIYTTKAMMIVSAYFDAFINIPLKLLVIWLLKLFGYVVISEEYAISTIFDYLYAYSDLNIKLKFYTVLPIKVLYSLVSKQRPDIMVMLNVDERNLLLRWRLRGYGDPQLKYVKAQKAFLERSLLGIKNFVVNTNELGPKKTTLIIVGILQKEINSRR